MTAYLQEENRVLKERLGGRRLRFTDAERHRLDIGSRSVHIAGITPHPDNLWMTQIARNITDVDDGFLRGKQYLILDRDAKYSDEFRNVLVREGIHVFRLPPRSPNSANRSALLRIAVAPSTYQRATAGKRLLVKPPTATWGRSLRYHHRPELDAKRLILHSMPDTSISSSRVSLHFPRNWRPHFSAIEARCPRAKTETLQRIR
jgi:hypothetical protein